MQPPDRHFAVVRFRKTGACRFLSHLDLARAMDRAVRRARLPVKYSEGFNPIAQIGFASALPVGVAGEGELCQIELECPVHSAEVARVLSAQLPPDLGIVDVSVVSGPKRKHLSGLTVADYEIALDCTPPVSTGILSEAVARLLAAEGLTIQRETSTRTYDVDIRPGVHSLELLEPVGTEVGPMIRMSLALPQDSLVKPFEVLESLQRQIADLTEGSVVVTALRVTRLSIH